ncbi:hypothetical protein LCGC14_1653160 [marine sediment metagenome]|uniref:Tyr recombinase domain-containing protein n=1 Tax=marine sediment metagenome TaxID=412755 RepID=A0A0F9HWA5_9ZZZZ
MNRPVNKTIITKYLERYSYSNQSVKTRKSSLNYFFKPRYFDYKRHIFDIHTDTLIDYFDYLKHLKTISLGTKKTKWTLLISFLNFCMEYFRKYNFIVIIPKYSINWSGINHKEPESNKDIVMTKEEVRDILEYLKLRHFKYYLIFRIFSEVGMRKGELINIDYKGVNLEKRFIKTMGKTGTKVYYISQELGDYLKLYLKERKLKIVKSNALFLSIQSKRYTERQFNAYLKKVLYDLKIKKNITCHTFRRTLNTLRKIMGCPNEDRKILLNHKLSDINVESYVKLNYKQFIELYDKWYPYNEIIL